MPGQAIQVGPFLGGLNTFSDGTAIADNELSVCENFELDIDGSLKSRPPFVDVGTRFPLAPTSGNVEMLGYYIDDSGESYLLASDGLSSTYYFDGNQWTLITSTFSATSMAQFDHKAWMTASPGSANPGGYWTPTDGFTAVADMPEGDVVIAHKFRLWVIKGKDASADGTRLYHSATLGASPFWPVAPDFIDIGAGDGQNIVSVLVYYNNLLILRTHSIYSLQYTTDPASGIVSLIAPGVGLAHKDAMAIYENYLYFMYDDRAYEFSNSRSTHLNVKVPFESPLRIGIYRPFSVSIFNQRVVFSYYDRIYVFGLRTRTWTVWKSDSFGPMGKMLTSPDTSANETALVHSSTSVPLSLPRTNLATNPRCISSGAAVGTPNNSLHHTSVFNGATGNAPPELPTMTTALEVTPISSTPFLVSVFNLDGQADNATARRLGAWVYVAGSGYEARCGSVSPYVPLSPGWNWVAATVSVTGFDAGALYVKTINGSDATGSALVTAIMSSTRDETLNPNDYRDGSYDDTVWSGTENASTSIQTPARTAITLTLTDSFDIDEEQMTCTLETKNFNYEASSIYKRLFSWGVDAIFRGQVTATAIPITFNHAVTWGQLRLAGTTWGSLRRGGFTWGQPTSGGMSVETVVDTSGVSSSRKFIKFRKSLRFRQIRYRLVFDTNGSATQAPVRVFSLMTYVKPKEKVSKQVT